MYTWSNASSRGGSRGGRDGARGGAELGPGRRVWRNGGGPGYTGETASSAARLTKSISGGGNEGLHSSLWGDQGQSASAGRGGYWGQARGRGAPPRGRGGSSQGSELRSSISSHEYGTSTYTDVPVPSTRESSSTQSPVRGTRGRYTTSAARGGRGAFGNSAGYTGRGGYEGRGRGGQTQRGRGGFQAEGQEGTRWGDSATSGSADPWTGFPYSGSAATSNVTDLWGGAGVQDNNSAESARGSFRGRGAGRGRDGTSAGTTSGWNEQPARGGRGGRGRTPSGGRGWTPRGERGGRSSFQGQEGPSSPPGPEVNLPPPRDIMGNLLVPAIVQLSAPEEVSLEKPIVIEDFRTISSYTWSKDKNPTIIVPGAPRQWLDRPLPIRVPFDKGIRIFHEDALHMGAESTLLPLFRAVDALAAHFVPQDAVNESAIDWSTVDFVTDRNNLRKLIRWVREPYPTPSPTPSPSGADTPAIPTDAESEVTASSDSVAWDPRKDFRIDMQLGGASTVLMHRWAAQAREWVEPPKAGCRWNFERESTAAVPACEDGGGHYRIVQYSIGGLKLVVRFESPVSPKEVSLWGDTPAPISGAEWGPADVAERPAVAPQKIVKTEEVDLWGGPVSAPSDWGVSEPSPASDSQDNKGGWEIKSDVSAWGPVDDATSWGSTTIKDEVAAWVPAKTAGALGDATAWGVGDAGHASVRAGQGGPLTKPGAKSDAPSWGPSTAVDFDTTSSFVPIADFKVIRAGTLLPQSNILELATRSAKYLDRTSGNDTFLQMFLTQTPTHLIAVHQRGTFERVIRQELASEEFMRIGEVEDIRRGIAQFVELLREIQRLVKEHGKEGRVSLVCEKGKLEMFGLVGQEGLVRQEELARFDRGV
ncbi:hypothetical protein C8T65DRAFT_679060 [Cerioporus squamosus]|nr:hypothetical protein C8T65DRAFT_679060 [Cerioporus squamosus]